MASHATKKSSQRAEKVGLKLRFQDAEHQELVKEAWQKSKLPSLNAWLVQATLHQARLQLGR
jgi:hypothetical protein